MKSYSELIKLESFSDRLNYLRTNSTVGADTFGGSRYLNQTFYRSKEWKTFRNKVIDRDNGCDLAVEGFIIPEYKYAIIHHINPITEDDIICRRDCLFDMDNVITTTLKTHNAIHYGLAETCDVTIVNRSPGDTAPWKII